METSFMDPDPNWIGIVSNSCRSGSYSEYGEKKNSTDWQKLNFFQLQFFFLFMHWYPNKSESPHKNRTRHNWSRCNCMYEYCTVHICCTSTVLYCTVQICCKAKFCTHVNKSQTFTFTFASFSANPQARFSCREIQIIFGTVFLQHSELLMCTFVNIAERTLGTVQNTWPCCWDSPNICSKDLCLVWTILNSLNMIIVTDIYIAMFLKD